MMTDDLINHPPHYRGQNFEAIDLIEDWALGYHLGNVVKYLVRHRRKGGLSDIRKARWYAQRFAGNENAIDDLVMTMPAQCRFRGGTRVADNFYITDPLLISALVAICDTRMGPVVNNTRVTARARYIVTCLDDYISQEEEKANRAAFVADATAHRREAEFDDSDADG